MAISQEIHRDSFCWSYMKSGQYNVELGYWVSRNIVNQETKIIFSETYILTSKPLFRKQMLLGKCIIAYGKLQRDI